MKLLILPVLCMAALTAGAQSVPGTWKTLPMQGTSITDIVETPTSVYYVSAHHAEYKLDNSFFHIDKESNEKSYVTPGVSISDGGVANMKYNPEGGYLLLTYTNGNIDLLYDSGRVVNLPEIKDAKVTGSKTINDVFFSEGRIYVATDFGIVIYDDTNHVVIESGIFKMPVRKIGRMGDKLLIYGFLDPATPNVYTLMSAPLDGRHNALDRFSLLRSNVSINDWIIPDDNSYITIGGSGNSAAVVKVGIQPDGEFTFTTLASVPGAVKFKACDTGYYCVGTNKIVFIDKDGNLLSAIDVDASAVSNTSALWKSSLKNVWTATGNSVGAYDLSDGGKVTVVSPVEAEGAKTFNNAFVVNSHDGCKAYINGVGQSEYHPCADAGWGLEMPLLLASYDWATGEVKDAYPEVTKQYSSSSQAEQNKFKVNALFGGCAKTVIDPVDPSLIYHANQYDGLFLIRDREIVYCFTYNNSPLFTRSGVSRVHDLAFDSEGNLWVGLWRGGTASNTSTKGVYKVLPKESLELARTNPAALTEKDASGQYKHWLQPQWVDADAGKCDVHMAFSGTKGVKVDGSWNNKLIGVDTKGTTSVNDDSYVLYNGFTDQDGTTTNPSMKGCITVDKNGWFWIGTNAGIYIIKDLDQIGQNGSNLNAVRPKVAREDGTDYADYLLASEKIYWIDVDANNNKWIATSNSGLYYVNADGSRILDVFDKSNSPMRTNEVLTVISNPNGNDVLVGTREGMYVYGSTASPGAADYSEVKVYPNPVRPEYSGWVTIEGLIGNSLVKITDASGNVVWTGSSEGGTCSWDGCDGAGNRVHSGVYMVFASQNSEGTSGAAVSKIVVIN